MPELIIEQEPREHLLDQWRNTEVDRILELQFAYRYKSHGGVLRGLIDSFSLKTARGVWLDRIGDWIGLERPRQPQETRVFGFAPQDIGFNQGPFSNRSGGTFLTRAEDDVYRKLLWGRTYFLLSNGSIVDHTEIVRAIFADPGESAQWTDNFDMTATLDTRTEIYYFYQIAKESRLLDPPAGVRRIPAFNIQRLTIGLNELFRGVIDISALTVEEGDFLNGYTVDSVTQPSTDSISITAQPGELFEAADVSATQMFVIGDSDDSMSISTLVSLSADRRTITYNIDADPPFSGTQANVVIAQNRTVEAK